MCYNIVSTPKFEKDVKFYKNKKKYNNITNDIANVVLEIATGNFVGDVVSNLKINNNSEFVIKARVANSDTKERQV